MVVPVLSTSDDPPSPVAPPRAFVRKEERGEDDDSPLPSFLVCTCVGWKGYAMGGMRARGEVS